jgi:2-polyprenyl-6-methoxyphenol hydroxylase-like FAD-dependent oxidoreductase
MINKRVLVSGASIGGPALAHRLHRYGFDVTVVEKAREIRRGGQAVDFKGPVHHRVLGEMGILDQVRAAGVVDADGRIVNAKGRTIGVVPAAFAGGEINIPRGDLARILTTSPRTPASTMSRATLDHYSTGRVALVGDSAWGNALGGFGTGLALVGA